MMTHPQMHLRADTLRSALLQHPSAEVCRFQVRRRPASRGARAVICHCDSRGQVWYFAYGANLSYQVLRSRGVAPPEQALPAVAPADATLTFQHRGGFATIDWEPHVVAANPQVPKLHDAVCPDARDRPNAAAANAAAKTACSISRPHGMLYLLTQGQLAALAARETGYRVATMPVRPYSGGETVAAKVFVSQRMLQLRRPVPPTRRYLDLIIDGTRSCRLSEEYVRQLKAVPTAPPGGLPAEYFDTPSSAFAFAAVAAVTILAIGFWVVHR